MRLSGTANERQTPEEPHAHQARETAHDEVAQPAGEPRMKRNRPRRWIALREQRQIRNVATTHPTGPERRRKQVPPQIQPAVSGAPGPVAPFLERLAAVTENAPHRGQPRRPAAGTDAEFYRVQPLESRQVAINNGRGQRGHRARPADDRHTALPGGGIETFDAGDKLPPIGEVDVVTTRGDRGHRHGVLLGLERAGGVNQCIDAQFLQPRAQPGIVGIDHDRLVGGKAQPGDEGRGLGGIAARHE